VVSTGLQGWGTDPFGVHEARYFSAGQPTKLVRDGGVESFDEPPSGAEGLAVVTATATAELHLPGLGDAGLDDGYPGGPGLVRIPRRRPWDGVAWACITILAAAALVIGVVITQAPEQKPATTLDTGTAATVAFVTQSARGTLAERTADMTMSGTVHVASTSVPISGTGQIDFTTKLDRVAAGAVELGEPRRQ